MTSEAKANANRRNAEKSTGPKTAEGKAVAAQNAVKHSLLARTAVIKDADPDSIADCGFRRSSTSGCLRGGGCEPRQTKPTGGGPSMRNKPSAGSRMRL